MKNILLSAAIVLCMFQLGFAQTCSDLAALPVAISEKITGALACVDCDDLLTQLKDAFGESPDPAFQKEFDKMINECKKFKDSVNAAYTKNVALYKKDADAAKVKCDACPDAMLAVLAPALTLPNELDTCFGECSSTTVPAAITAAANAITAAKTAVDAYKCSGIPLPYTAEFTKFLTDEAKRQLKNVQTTIKALIDAFKKQVAVDKQKATECVKSKLTPVLNTVKAFKCP